jgi:hypothetical protein
MANATRMASVDEPEFNEWVRRHNAVPDGFKANGSMIQTRYYLPGHPEAEVAQFSRDSFGEVWEINPNVA